MSSAQRNMLSLNIPDPQMLHAMYMPFLKNGGIFVATTQEYKMGDEVFLLLVLPDDPGRTPISGQVAWITPANALGNKKQGVGIHFMGAQADSVKERIEKLMLKTPARGVQSLTI